MAAKPLAAIVSCTRLHDGRPVQSVSNRFLEPVSAVAGLQPLLVPSIPGVSDAKSLARVFDALMLTGSCSDVSPTRYGATHPPRGPEDHGRDDMALALAAEMILLGKPVFGICRGAQEINVLFGGTLKRDLSVESDLHHPRGADYADALSRNIHPVALRDGVLGPAETIDVVSAHHQGIDRLGCGLVAQAHAPDGLVEAVHAEGDAFVLGVQWHPEMTVDSDPHSRTFYTLLGSAARREIHRSENQTGR